MKPVRLQLSRRKGFSLQQLSMATNGLPAVVVRRPTKWGNPFTVAKAEEAGYEDSHAMAAYAYRQWLNGDPKWSPADGDRNRIISDIQQLRGKNLACTCRLDQACHADVLLSLANAASPGDGG